MTKTLPTLTLAILILAAGCAILTRGPADADETKTAPKSAKAPPEGKPLVRWHQDRPQAAAQAKQLNRPLLVFQLLGSLDQEFC